MAEPDPAASPVIWGPDGALRSRAFGDVYFSTSDGLAEARAVFLAGCDLPDGWAGRDRFTVGELGFGSGLNILALLDLWRRARPIGGRLHIFSVEAFPMTADDARRALAAWPEMSDLAGDLIERWPRRARGFHRIDFPALDAYLDLAVMDVLDALEGWGGQADAWFLDGFSPALNPGMWTPAVFEAVVRRSAPGARAATFTVAGAVRRGLAAAGFAVAKAQGFGRKRERLEARLPAAPSPAPSRAKPRVAIVGAGVAGAALARAFRALGASVQVFEATAPGAGASGNPAVLVMPRLDAGGGAVAQLYAQAIARAHDLYAEVSGAVIARGALQLETGPKDPSRFDRIAASDLFQPGAVARLDMAAMDHALGEPAPAGGLALAEAMTASPGAILAAWLGDTARGANVARVEPADEGWRLLDAAGGEIARAEIVCLAAGLGCRDLTPLPLTAVRGQASFPATSERPAAAIGAGYLIPTGEGLLFGATHDRDDEDVGARAEDTARNLALLRQMRPALADALAAAPLEARAGVRAVTPDFLPLAGALGETAGLFVLTGLGSRGFCAAPLLAEHVAALALGAPSPLPRALAAIVDPARFETRRERRLARSARRSTAIRPPTPDEAAGLPTRDRP